MKKIKRYLGLVVTFFFVLMLFNPFKSYDDGHLNSGLQKTGIGRVIGNAEWVKFHYKYLKYNIKCKEAFNRFSVNKQFEPLLTMYSTAVEIECDPSDVIATRLDPRFGIGTQDLKLRETYAEYHEAWTQFRRGMPPPEGLTRPTKELLKFLDEEAASDRRLLSYLLLAAHIAVGALIALMIVFREAIGSGVLFPIQEIFGLIKNIHRRV